MISERHDEEEGCAGVRDDDQPGKATKQVAFVSKDLKYGGTHDEALPAGTKPKTAHHRSPAGERRAQSQGQHTIDRLQERGGHKAKDSTPSIACRREAGTKPKTAYHRPPAGERQAQSQGQHTIDRLQERGGHKAKDCIPSIAYRREAGTKPGTAHRRSHAGERRAQNHGQHTVDRMQERQQKEAVVDDVIAKCPSSVRPTLNYLKGMRDWGKSRQTRWNVYGLSGVYRNYFWLKNLTDAELDSFLIPLLVLSPGLSRVYTSKLANLTIISLHVHSWLFGNLLSFLFDPLV